MLGTLFENKKAAVKAGRKELNVPSEVPPDSVTPPQLDSGKRTLYYS